MIKYKYSKPLLPQKLQASQIADLKQHQIKMKAQAEKYLDLATIQAERCPICAENNYSVFLEIYGYNYFQCNNCRHVYLERYLSHTNLVKYYSDSTQYAATYTNPDQLTYRMNKIAKPKVAFVMEHIANLEGGTWLDVGTAIGDILYSVEQYPGWKATGIELSNDSVELGKKTWGVTIEQQLFRDYVASKPDTQFDVVSAFGYLGLIADPYQELERMSKTVKENGYLVIGDSCADSMSTVLQQSYPDLTLRHIIPPNIINCFTSESLTWSLDSLGFNQIAVWKFGMDFFELLKYLCLLTKGFQDSPIYGYLIDNANHFQKVIDKDKQADYQIVIAQKKL